MTPTKPKARKPFKQVINLFNDKNRFMYTPTPCICIPLDAASLEALREHVTINGIAVDVYGKKDAARIWKMLSPETQELWRQQADAVLAALGISKKGRK